MMSKTDLRRASVFHAIASAGGVAAAARHLGKSAPAIHHDLKRFETDAGCALFERVGRSLQLNAAGRLLYETIGRALRDIELARAQLAQLDPSVHPLRIGAVSGFGRYVLAPRLFAGMPSARRIELRFAEHDLLLDALRHNRIDLAITFRRVAATPIHSTAVAVENIALAAAITCDEGIENHLADAVFVTYDEHEYVFGPWFESVRGMQPASLKRGDHVTELEEALEAVACGRGVTIVPEDILRHPHWRERIRVIHPQGRAVRNTLYMLTLGAPSTDAELVAHLLGSCQASETKGPEGMLV